MQLLNYANISLQEGEHSIGTSWFYVSLIQARVTGEEGASTEKCLPRRVCGQAYGGGAFSCLITDVGGLIMGNVAPGVVFLGA